MPGSEYADDTMEAFSPEVLATMVAERFGDVHAGAVTAPMREDLTRQLERALRDAVLAARRGAAELCQQRQALWTATEAQATTSELLRAEARARANEAAYLADALQSIL